MYVYVGWGEVGLRLVKDGVVMGGALKQKLCIMDLRSSVGINVPYEMSYFSSE